MAVSIKSIEKKDLPEVVSLLNRVGLSCKEDKLYRFFFTDELQNSMKKTCAGFAVVDDVDGVVGFQGMTPCRLYNNQTPVIGFQLGVLGILPKYGSFMFDLIDAVIEKASGVLFFGNTSNQKSAALWTGYGGCSAGNPSQAFVRFAVPNLVSFIKYTAAKRLKGRVAWLIQQIAVCFIPVDACLRLRMLFHKNRKYLTRRLVSFDDSRFEAFWEKMLRENMGLIVARDPSRLRRLFNPALNEKRSVLLAAEAGPEIHGYILLKTCHARHMIVDWCAVGNDKVILECLLYGALAFSKKSRVGVLEYVGGIQQSDDLLQKYLPYKRKALANTFVYRAHDLEIKLAVENANSWFGGPYDGDRCAM